MLSNHCFKNPKVWKHVFGKNIHGKIHLLKDFRCEFSTVNNLERTMSISVMDKLSARTSELSEWEGIMEGNLKLVESQVVVSIDELEDLRLDVPHWTSAFQGVKNIACSKSKHMFRPKLVFLGFAAGSNNEKLLKEKLPSGLINFVSGVELQHLFMFVHDDMMDHALTRRGHDTIQVAISNCDREVNSKYNRLEKESIQHLTTLNGDLLQAKSLQLLSAGETQLKLKNKNNSNVDSNKSSSRSSAALDIILQGAFRAGAAQFEDILGWSGVETSLHQQNHNTNQNDLLRRLLEDKASFHSFAAPLIAGLRLSSHNFSKDELANIEKSCIKWAGHIGAAFQGLDDIMDFVLDAQDSGKDKLQDIQEGRLSLPLFMLRQYCQKEEWKQVIDILGSNSIMLPNDRQFLLKLVREYNLHEHSLDFVNAELNSARLSLKQQSLEKNLILSKGMNVFIDSLDQVSKSLSSQVSSQKHK